MRFMRTSRSTSVPRVLLVAALAAAAIACNGGGCGGGSAASAPAGSSAASAAPSASLASSDSGSPARPRSNTVVRAGGAAGAIFRAANSIELKEEQKATLDEIGADMREAERAARDGGDGGSPRNEAREAQAELAAGVKAGKIEPSKMAPHYAALEKNAKAREEREADALNRLHAALEPAQRAAIVASVRSFEEKRAGWMKLRDKADAGRPGASRLRLERYTRELTLDADQQKKVEAILPKDDKAASAREDAKKEMDVLLAAFEKDAFDAKKLDTGAAKRARAPIEEQAKFLSQLLPILRPEQRERLARTLGRTSEFGRPHRGPDMGERAHDPHDDVVEDDDVH